jgi:DNA-directed RNA polymerase subunit RPC12/RpoP
MGLTKCPDCGGLCFTKDRECASCSRQFGLGDLKAKLDAEERRSARKLNLVFAIPMLVLLIILVYVILHPELSQPIR